MDHGRGASAVLSLLLVSARASRLGTVFSVALSPVERRGDSNYRPDRRS